MADDIVSEAKKRKKEDRLLLLKELRIPRLIAENKPIVKAKKNEALITKRDQ